MDKFKLQYEMKKRGITIEQLCKALGMSKSAYYRKVNGTSDFTITEVKKIVEYLGLESPMGIFFTEQVS